MYCCGRCWFNPNAFEFCFIAWKLDGEYECASMSTSIVKNLMAKTSMSTKYGEKIYGENEYEYKYVLQPC